MWKENDGWEGIGGVGAIRGKGGRGEGRGGCVGSLLII